MKIAEALVKVKDLKGKVAELTRQIVTDSRFEQVEEGSEIPSVEPLIVDLLEVTEALSVLKTRITMTNATFGLTAKINEMERLRSLVSSLESLANHKQKIVQLRTIGYSDATAKLPTYATYDVEHLKVSLTEHRTRIRELDLELQRRNWEVDLVD